MAARRKSGGAGFGQRPRRAGGESQAVQGLASVPGERAGKVRRCRFWPASPESGRGKSGGAGFSQRPRRAGGESQAVQVLANVPGERAGKVRRCRVWPTSPEEQAVKVQRCRFWPSFSRSGRGSPAVQVLANINRDSRRVFEKVKTLQVSTFSNTLLPFFTGASPRAPSLTCDAARAGVAASL